MPFIMTSLCFYQGCFWHCIWHGKCRVSRQAFAFYRATFQEKLRNRGYLFHHGAVDEVDSCLHMMHAGSKPWHVERTRISLGVWELFQHYWQFLTCTSSRASNTGIPSLLFSKHEPPCHPLPSCNFTHICYPGLRQWDKAWKIIFSF